MNTKKVLIGTVAAIAIVAGGSVAVSSIWPTAPSFAAGYVAQKVDFDEHGGWRHGFRHHRGDRDEHGRGRGHARGLAMICSDERDRRIEHGLAFVEGFVNFTPEQTASWGELTKAVRAGSATIGEKCKELASAGEPKAAPERLQRVENIAMTGLAVLQSVRPAFDRFYETLSDKQKKALDDLIAHHRGRRS